MAYKLVITEHADKLLDSLVYYLLYRLKSEKGARHLLDGVENVYKRLEKNPLQFPVSRDAYLAGKDYREATVPQMDYVVVFYVKEDTVNVIGIFHRLENYQKKVQIMKQR